MAVFFWEGAAVSQEREFAEWGLCRRRMMLTDAEDHDIAPNNDGLAAERRKVSTVNPRVSKS